MSYSNINILASTLQQWQNEQMPPSNLSSAAELVKIVPEKNQARFYRLALLPNLFGEVSLVREYGRLGQNGGHFRADLFADENAAMTAYNRLLQQKLRRGYVAAGPRGR